MELEVQVCKMKYILDLPTGLFVATTGGGGVSHILKLHENRSDTGLHLATPKKICSHVELCNYRDLKITFQSRWRIIRRAPLLEVRYTVDSRYSGSLKYGHLDIPAL